MPLQDPHGVKVDCLCDNTGYVYNTMVSSHDPLKYNELRRRVVAVCYALLTSENLGEEGKSYMDENRIVQFYVLLNNATVNLKQEIFPTTIGFHRLPLHVSAPRERHAAEWHILGGHHLTTQ